jgi:pyruvate dehydrogenase E1 component beta subunit
MIIGRGWGQGPQHSQALHNFFVHIPGFRVYLPTTPQDAYLAILKSSKTKEPTIVFEHRWLYELTGQVDISIQDENLLGTRIVHSHKQSKVTLVTISFSTLEALRAQTFLSENSVEVDIIEVIRLDTLDLQPILESIRKTEKLVIMDIGHRKAGVASSILAELIKCNIQLSCPPVIIGLPEYPTPTAPSLSRHYYPKPFEVANTVMNLLELPQMTIDPDENSQLDIPENRFIGYY